MSETWGIACFSQRNSNGNNLIDLANITGWSSVAGESASVVSNFTANLSPQTLWITDLTFDQVRSNINVPNIRPNVFFRISLDRIVDETFSYPSDKKNQFYVNVITEHLSMVAEDIRRTTLHMFPNIKWGLSLKDSIGKAINLVNDNTYHPFLKEVMASDQKFSVVLNAKRMTSYGQEVSLVSNRVEHLEAVTGYPIPVGVPDHITDITLDELFYSLTDPAFAEIELYLDNAPYPELVAFGVNQQSIRKWVALPELYMLSEFGARIVLKSALIFKESRMIEPFKAIRCNAYAQLNYGMGIVAENYLAAHLSNTAGFAGAYLRSADRTVSFFKAHHLQKMGFPVTGYGYGRVSVRSPIEQLERLRLLASDMGFQLVVSNTNQPLPFSIKKQVN